MEANCIIIIPFVSVNEYVLQCVRECLKLDYDCYHLVLLPDVPVSLPSDLGSDRLTVIVTGDCTIAAKRNSAITNFPNAEYFAMIDSDAYPDTLWLKNGVAFLAGHSDVWAIGGPNIDPPGEPLLQRVVGNAQRSVLVSGPLYFTKYISSSRYCSSLHSCNLILPRRAFDILGKFDVTLFVGEDHNLCERIRAYGKGIYFDRSVFVYHYNRSLWASFFFQRVTYGYGDINSKRFNRGSLLQYIPVIWMLLFFLIVLYALFRAGSSIPVVGFIAINFMIALAEACRISDTKMNIPLTLAAILICYLGTTLGQVLALAGFSPNLKKIYSNHPFHASVD